MPILNVRDRALSHGDKPSVLLAINSYAIHVKLDHNHSGSDGHLSFISKSLSLNGLRAEDRQSGRMARG